MLSICCSFCGMDKEDLDDLEIPYKTGMEDNTFICYDCITTFEESVNNEFEDLQEDFNFSLLDKNPAQLLEELNKDVVGQLSAKKSIALAAYQHYKRIINKSDELEKNNILLIGPTGSGKTLLVKTLAKLLDVPIVISRANSITEAGYAGDDVESIIEALLKKAGGNVKKAECGIVFIDEIDKIKKAPDAGSIKDVSGVGAQNSLLTLLEDEDVIAYKRNDSMSPVSVNTKNILFIASGAFSGINEIINKRLNKKNSKIGFISEHIDLEIDQDVDLTNISTEDLINYGLIPEFIGRFPVIAALKGLSEHDLVNVIKEPSNSILKQYIKLFKNENSILNISEDVIHKIAKESLIKKTGARGLKSDFNKIFSDALFEVSSSPLSYKCVLNIDDYLKDKKPRLININRKNKKVSK